MALFWWCCIFFESRNEIRRRLRGAVRMEAILDEGQQLLAGIKDSLQIR